jgi:uncharacterized protein YndB with AHSA1/START domain
MAEKIKFTQEYIINISPNVLFSRLNSASGLSEWFADDVHVKGNKYTFIWNKSTEKAELVSQKKNKFVRFRWLDREETDEETGWFEFRIEVHDITGEVALLITDFCYKDEEKDAKELWNKQISALRRLLGK